MILVEHLENIIQERTIRPLSFSVGSLILCIPNPNGKGSMTSINYRHLNNYTKNEKTHLLIMDRLSRLLWECDYMCKVDIETGFHLIRIALGHQKFTAFRIKLGLHEHLVVLCGLPNAITMFEREINRILRQLLRIKMVIYTKR